MGGLLGEGEDPESGVQEVWGLVKKLTSPSCLAPPGEKMPDCALGVGMPERMKLRALLGTPLAQLWGTWA